jgi:23S rRNA (cytosine1962-C5)-methyltransferase
MFATADYQLVDFGGGRKLERFGPHLLDRPAPAAEGVVPADPRQWQQAARYEWTTGDRGIWRSLAHLPERWTIQYGRLALELKATPFGHLGLFPEQAANWAWIAKQVAAAGRRLKVLNLFSYTGASTLAAAAAGAEVVHVDAARNTVAWARRNAEISSLASAPIRWICDDTATFVRRELKRDRRYDAVILDPPSYGHGAQGKVWKLADDLPRLLADVARLTAYQRSFVLLTCHTPGFHCLELGDLLADTMGPGDIECGPMELATAAGRTLACGAMARWTPNVAGTRLRK